MHLSRPGTGRSFKKLHGAAVDGAVLADDTAAVYGHHGVVWESLLYELDGSLVVDRLSVGGNQNSIVDNEEIGVSGRQPFAIIVDGVGHWQPYQTVGLTLDSAERQELLLHEFQVGIMLVFLVVTSHI